jgi:hypothetical protein
MTEAPPIPMMWDDAEGTFRPLPNFLRVARQHYGSGGVVPLVALEERSRKSHAHYFACVHEAWVNLPEPLAVRFKSDEALRKFALIQTGHRHEQSTVCMFKTEATRLAAAMQPVDEFSVVVVSGKIVTRYTAKSQSIPKMGNEAFQKSKVDVLAYLADMIGVAPEALSRARAA